MKGFLSWIKSSAKIKRWIFLILVGIILSCYGFAEILVSREMDFVQVAKVIGVFVVGFTCVVIGLVFIQKRTLELVIESETKKDEIDIQSLIFNKNVYDKGPNIVVIGGGSGLNTVLEGLKNYTSNITAIVTISDYGKAASDSRRQLELLPLDDIKDSLVALSAEEQNMDALMNHKFENGRLKELCFGDIYLSAMKEIYGDFAESIEKSSDVLKITGKVLPVTLDEITICAELKDGTIVEQKDKIPSVVTEKVSSIQRMFITPTNSKPSPGVIEAIQKADAIIIGPGSLYTNVIPNLLIKGVAKAIKESKAIKVYVTNIMTEPGQTDNFSITDHIDAIIGHVGTGIFDFCICDTGEITPEFVRRYNQDGSDIVEQDISKANTRGINIIRRDLSYIKGEYIRHNPDVIASTIIELICNDLRYKDKQNETQYFLLNSKLKEEKKNDKKRKKAKREKVKETKPKKGSRLKKKSKFQAKYNERIKSIKTSDKKRVENLKLQNENEKLEKKNAKHRSVKKNKK